MKKLAFFFCIFLLAFLSASTLSFAQYIPPSPAPAGSAPDYSYRPDLYPANSNQNPVATFFESDAAGDMVFRSFPTRGCVGRLTAVGYLWTLEGQQWMNSFTGKGGLYQSNLIGMFGGNVLLDLGSFTAGQNAKKTAVVMQSQTGAPFVTGRYQLVIAQVLDAGQVGCAVGTTSEPVSYYEIPTFYVGGADPTALPFLGGGPIRVTPFQETQTEIISAPSRDFQSGQVTFLDMSLFPTTAFVPGVMIRFHILDLRTGQSVVWPRF